MFFSLGYIAAKRMFFRSRGLQDKNIPEPVPDRHGRYSGSLMEPTSELYYKNKIAKWKIMLTYPVETLSLPSEDGLRLVGYLYRNGDSKKTAVLIHGFHSGAYEGCSHQALEYIARGYNVFFPDNRACTGSEGNYLTYGIMEQRDTIRWLEYLAQRFPEDSILVHGVSLGGATTCFLADKNLPEQVKALVSDCAFAEMRKVLAYVSYKSTHVPPWLLMPISECWFRCLTGLDYDTETPLKAVSAARLPMYFVTGEQDNYIPMEHTLRLYNACPTDKEIRVIRGAGHAAALVVGGDDYMNPIVAFVEKYL